MSASIWRRSEASSLRRVFSWRTLSWDSDIWLSLSIKLWFSVLSRTTCDQSSSKCFCFLILDLRADSRLDIILLCFLSSMMLKWISSASSEVELLLMQEPEGGKWQFGKLLRRVFMWMFGMSLCRRPKFGGTRNGFSGARKWTPLISLGTMVGSLELIFKIILYGCGCKVYSESEMILELGRLCWNWGEFIENDDQKSGVSFGREVLQELTWAKNSTIIGKCS